MALLTYEAMESLMKKFFNLLPSLTIANKHLMEELHAPGAVASYGEDASEADHVSGHEDVYRAYLTYEPWPFYMMIDDRKNLLHCLVKEEAKHPVTGEIVKAFKGFWTPTGEPTGIIYMDATFEFVEVNGEAKILNAILTIVDPNGSPFLNWKNKAKHGGS